MFRKMALKALVVFVFVSVVAAQEYLVGSGDTLYIMVWGHEELTGTTIVAPDGTMVLPTPVGVVEVRGKTVKQIEELLTTQLSRYIKSPEVTVSLREMGFLIHIIGEVAAPSYYKIPEGTTLQELITRAGGLTKYADTKHIRVTSRSEDGTTIAQEINFHKFLKENDVTANPILKPNDVIFVTRIKDEEYLNKMVIVLGSVQGAGSFELDEGMALLDVIALSDGFATDADLEKVQIIDLNSEDSNSQTVNLKKFLTERDSSGNPIVHPRMVIYVPSTNIPAELTIPINVVGQVLRPGAYRVVAERSHLTDVIFTAGGPGENADMEKIKILHINSGADGKDEFNLKNFLVNGELRENPVLEEGDTVIVPLSDRAKQISLIDTAFVPYKTVNIIGEVRNPGTYQVPAKATLLDVLILGGGTTSVADLERTTVIRETGGQKFEVDLRKVFTEGRFELLPKLESEDTIFVPQQKESKWRQMVRLSGEVSTVAVLVLILMGRR